MSVILLGIFLRPLSHPVLSSDRRRASSFGRTGAESIERRHAWDQSLLAREVRQLLNGQIPPWPGS